MLLIHLPKKVITGLTSLTLLLRPRLWSIWTWRWLQAQGVFRSLIMVVKQLQTDWSFNYLLEEFTFILFMTEIRKVPWDFTSFPLRRSKDTWVNFFTFVFIIVYVCMHLCATACVWRSEDNSRESVLSFHLGFQGLNSDHKRLMVPAESLHTDSWVFLMPTLCGERERDVCMCVECVVLSPVCTLMNEITHPP